MTPTMYPHASTNGDWDDETIDQLKQEVAELRQNRLRLWWIPQVPMEPFYVNVASPEEAKKILTVLADYDIFQLDNRIKPDFCNAGGLEEFVDGKWEEWEDENGEPIEF